MLPMLEPQLKKFDPRLNESRMALRLVFLKKIFVDSSDVLPRLRSIALEEFSDSPGGSLLHTHMFLTLRHSVAQGLSLLCLLL